VAARERCRQEIALDGQTPEHTEQLTYPVRRTPWQRVGRQLRIFAALAAAIAGLYVLGDWIYDRFTHVYIDDARIGADVISISSRVSGLVTSLHVVTGKTIKAGDTLVRIDDREAKLRQAELGARLASIDAERERLKAQRKLVDLRTSSQYTVHESRIEAAKAALAGRRLDLDLARTDYQRARTLHERKVVSRQRLDEKRSVFRVAEQAYQEARAEVSAANAGLLGAAADRQQLQVIDRQITALSHQQDELRTLWDRMGLDLGDRVIRSPIDGVVDKTFVNPSEYISVGQRLLMVHDPSKIWVDANVKETDIRHLKLGSPAKISIDAYPDEVFKGTITRIGNAATSQFALLPTPNPSGNFTKIAQRLTIRVDLEKASELLRPGMMVEVNIGIDGR
jgi:membrane fusion protein, multidrug efflux system